MLSSSISPIQVLVMWWSALPLLVATLIGTIRFRQLPVELRYLVSLTWWMMSVKIGSRLLWLLHLPNLFLKPLYAVGKCLLLVLMYAQAIQRPFINRRLYGLVGVFISYILLDTLVPEKVAFFRPKQEIITSSIILLLVGLYFKKLLDELTVHRLDKEPMFWVSAGLFFYSTGSVLMQLLSDYVLRHNIKGFNMTIWILHALLLACLTSCYAIALYLARCRHSDTYFLEKKNVSAFS